MEAFKEGCVKSQSCIYFQEMLTGFLFALPELRQLKLPPSGRKLWQNRGECDSSQCKKTEKVRHSHSLDSQRILALIPASDLSLTQLYSGGLLGTQPPPPPLPLTSCLLSSAALYCPALHVTGAVRPS